MLGCANEVVRFVARHGVFFGRILSPIGRNASLCCMRYGFNLDDMKYICKDFVRAHCSNTLISVDTVLTALQLLKPRYFYMNILSSDELSRTIDYLATWWVVFSFFAYMYYVYDFNNNNNNKILILIEPQLRN